jgi:hypothetical protein
VRRAALLAAAVVAAAGSVTSAAAQSLAARVDAVRDGTILMTFAARAGVCANPDGTGWGTSRWNDGQRSCVPGPVRVAIGRSDRSTVSVRVRVGGAWHAGGSETDLGTVAAPDAARYLVALAKTVAGRNANDALAAAAIADSVDISPDLARIVRDSDASLDARKQAVFWFGQSTAATSELVRLFDARLPSDLRTQFTFVLSQRRDDLAVDKLIDVARHDADHEIRKQAMYWLGQSQNPKAYAFLRDILTK